MAAIKTKKERNLFDYYNKMRFTLSKEELKSLRDQISKLIYN